ncbi:hypothetical protein BDV33DRAFT_207507 [Aspergillus novoparasiticus]|uniref:Uncharacterized protein n=1 Tax=Aspergillus novoparasiticus TaxID=986946 RepID=A0A5N6EFD8_9EURO|nr:hypothetical protein BDV33DRAFT_207507 [Aspergillus novoparasiticus]
MDLPELQLICQNILELAMCRAFQSLPPSSLTQIFGEDADNPYTCVGLNIVSPLFPGLNLRKEACQHFTRQIESSPDPEIRLWPSYRSREKGKAKKAESAPTKTPKPMMRLEDFRAAILSAVAAKPDLAHLQLPDFHKEIDREDRVVDHIDSAQKKSTRGGRNLETD